MQAAMVGYAVFAGIIVLMVLVILLAAGVSAIVRLTRRVRQGRVAAQSAKNPADRVSR